MNKRLVLNLTKTIAVAGITLQSAMAMASGQLLVWEDIKKSMGNEDANKAFEQIHDVKITIQELPYGGQLESLRLDGPAGTGPDVITIPHDQLGAAVVQGLLSPMAVDKDILASFTTPALTALTYKGTLYGLPKAIETVVMVYNKDLVPELPTHLNDILALSKKFREKGDYGLLAKWDEFYYAYGILAGYGADVFATNEDGTLNANELLLNNAGAVQAATYINSFYADKVFPSGIIGDSGANAIDSLFTGKKAAIVQTGPWSLQPYKEAGINYGVAPLPILENGEHMRSFLGVKGYSISIYSKNKPLAQQYIEFINNYDNAKRRFELTGEIPPVKSLINDPLIKSNEGARAVAIQAAYAVPMPSIPEMAEVWGPMNGALQLINTGKQAPKEALDAAVKTIHMQIDANHAMNQ